MFDLDKTPYGMLGEAHLVVETGNTKLTLGRQALQIPLMASYDYRIIPNLYEGGILTTRGMPGLTVTLGHITEMSGLDGLVSFSQFRSMSAQTYTSLILNQDGEVDTAHGDTLVPATVVGRRGVTLFGVEHTGNHPWRLWNAHGHDTVNTLYADSRLGFQPGPDMTADLSWQAYRVWPVGSMARYLSAQGLNADYALLGLRGTLNRPSRGLAMSLAWNRFSGNRNTVTTFGNWGGYPEFVGMPYLFAEQNSASAIAGSQLAKLTVRLDMERWGLKNHTLTVGHTRVNLDEDVMPDSDIQVTNLIYRAGLGKNWTARLALETRDSANLRYDNDFIAASLRYDF